MSEPLPAIQPSERTRQAAAAVLLEEALRLLDRDLPGARRRIEDARELVGHQKQTCGKNGRLADWQLLRASKYIRENLHTRLRIGTVARIVNLSPSYFSRAFKTSEGMPFSEFVLVSRIGLAKHLLTTTDRPIAQIALECGLADQSHLTRIFNRFVGVPPRAWRCRSMAEAGRHAHRAGGDPAIRIG
ncbi:AraC family transcriptional regulator [Bradyrhizobium sp. NAS96.2]|uniref:helix-turn-helix domain-containing protein n=1 Tax=Bradyrhizobium sp. NAS96.2 TaxID=1680160 RepID=UPI00093FAC87|nr:AraC family transcriptional regulator [Bradyrhizobium sp. NAS96.2]